MSVYLCNGKRYKIDCDEVELDAKASNAVLVGPRLTVTGNIASLAGEVSGSSGAFATLTANTSLVANGPVTVNDDLTVTGDILAGTLQVGNVVLGMTDIPIAVAVGALSAPQDWVGRLFRVGQNIILKMEVLSGTKDGAAGILTVNLAAGGNPIVGLFPDNIDQTIYAVVFTDDGTVKDIGVVLFTTTTTLAIQRTANLPNWGAGTAVTVGSVAIHYRIGV